MTIRPRSDAKRAIIVSPMNRQNALEAKQRIADRRQREDEAPRLAQEIRGLTGLDLTIDNAGNSYIWRIVVDRAPAIFEVACNTDGCEDGGHDLTREILQRLRASSKTFVGESVCRGGNAQGNCNRVLKYVAKATYGGR